MKINKNKVGTYSTPHIKVIVNKYHNVNKIRDIGFHFGIWNYHWWVTYEAKDNIFKKAFRDFLVITAISLLGLWFIIRLLM